MLTLKKSSITDLPKHASEEDRFGIKPFERGLIKFIENTSTPITIALQGEWGSGKTSLMNSLKLNLCDKENAPFHGIWLNTWEYALMKDAKATLMDIITDLIKEISKIAEVEENKTKKLLKGLWSGVRDTTKVIAKNALDNTVAGAGTIVDAFSSSEGQSTIGDIRNELEQIIEDNLKKTGKKGFIFFIDDLDRIDPPVAVELLELLKNIFTLRNAIFVLAIDYDVVVKGLEPKFGKFTAANEREFRSFFDKIIQVPFSMPVSNYQINDFIKQSLMTIDYLNEKQLNNEELVNNFAEIAHLTVGTNPRALKRLMNSLSLINYINSEKSSEENQLKSELELLINFALVSIQIAYPSFYRLLAQRPGFTDWDESIAIQMNLPPLNEEIRRKLNEREEFDEEWEKIVFRISETDPYLRKKALSISRLLNKIRNIITESGEDIENTVGAIISLSSVTNTGGMDEVKEVTYHKGSLLKNVRWRIIEKLKEKLPDIAEHIAPKGRRVQSNAPFKLSPEPWKDWIQLSTFPYQDKIRLFMSTAKWIGEAHGSYEQDWKKTGVYQEIVNVLNRFEQLGKKYPNINTFNTQASLNEIRKIQRHHSLNLYAYVDQNTPDDFYKEDLIDEIASFVAEWYPLMLRLNELTEIHNQKWNELNQ